MTDTPNEMEDPHTCQGCGQEFDLAEDGYYVDTCDVGEDADGHTALVFRQDAEQFGDWLGFKDEDIGAWCESCSWPLQRRRTHHR